MWWCVECGDGVGGGGGTVVYGVWGWCNWEDCGVCGVVAQLLKAHYHAV